MNVAEELVSRIPSASRLTYSDLLAASALSEARVVDSELLGFVGPSLRLLEEVGHDGIPLSAITGPGSGETPAGRSVREQLVTSVILRVDNGRLTRTPVGQAVSDLPEADRPLRLWRHLAATLPNAAHEISADGVTLLLLVIAADAYGPDYQDAISAGLAALGWRTTEGDTLDKWDAFEAVVGPFRFLSHAGAVASVDGTAPCATPVGIAFAREALRVEAASART